MDFLQTIETFLFEILQNYSNEETYPNNLQPSIETLEPLDAKKRFHLIILEIKKTFTGLCENFQKDNGLMKESKQEKEQLLLKTQNLKYQVEILLNKIQSARIDQKPKNKLINLNILSEEQDELELFNGGELKLRLEKKLKESETLSSELKLLREKKYDLIRSNTKQETFLRSLRSKIIEIPENCPTTLKFLSLPSPTNKYNASKKKERSLPMASALPLPLFTLYRAIKQYIRTHLDHSGNLNKNNNLKNIRESSSNMIFEKRNNGLLFNKSRTNNQNLNKPQSPQVNIEVIRHNPKTLTCRELKNKSKISRHHLGLNLKINNIIFTISWIPTLAVLTINCSKPFLIDKTSNNKENLLFEFDSIAFGLALDWIQKLAQDENSNNSTKANSLNNFKAHSEQNNSNGNNNNDNNNNNNNNMNKNCFFKVLTHNSQKDNFEQFVQIIYNRAQSYQSLKNQISQLSKFDINSVNLSEKFNLPLPKAMITKSIEESKNTLLITVRKNKLMLDAKIKLDLDYPFVFPEFTISLSKESGRGKDRKMGKGNLNSSLIKLNHEKHVFINSELTNSSTNHKIANMDLQFIETELNAKFPFQILNTYGNHLPDRNQILSLQTLHFLYCVDKLEKGKRIGKMRYFM
ncbi:fms interacting protein [Anaeramoeba flamelloides]|uniref:Fms interacting protein n=1 Tax=Anaeramoeba flamelloides TaxID=1746091 RepID=A0ABQ8YEI2_9EUKA|nr:fms interacting protein [Anaeramoeba flamelloides]